MAKKPDSFLQEMMYNNFTRCCELTQALFDMKFAFYKSLFPNLDDNALLIPKSIFMYKNN